MLSIRLSHGSSRTRFRRGPDGDHNNSMLKDSTSASHTHRSRSLEIDSPIASQQRPASQKNKARRRSALFIKGAPPKETLEVVKYKYPAIGRLPPTQQTRKNTAKLFASAFRRTLRSSAGLSIAAAATTIQKTSGQPAELGVRRMHSKVVSMLRRADTDTLRRRRLTRDDL